MLVSDKPLLDIGTGNGLLKAVKHCLAQVEQCVVSSKEIFLARVASGDTQMVTDGIGKNWIALKDRLKAPQSGGPDELIGTGGEEP